MALHVGAVPRSDEPQRIVEHERSGKPQGGYGKALSGPTRSRGASHFDRAAAPMTRRSYLANPTLSKFRASNSELGSNKGLDRQAPHSYDYIEKYLSIYISLFN